MTTVLIVEDDPNTRMFTSINLSTRGYSVVEARDGQEGVDKLRRDNPDVVLLDIRLPEVSGLEILDYMARDRWLARIPVIVMTASHLNLIDEVWENHQAMVTEVLIKPFRAERLLAAIADAVKRG
jgi:CheY-like chemotaxis protein